MKKLLAILLSLAFASIGFCDDRLIPFDNFYLELRIKEGRNREGDGDGISVSLITTKSEKEPEGTAIIHINYFGFPDRKSAISFKALEAFIGAGKAVENGEEFRKEILTPLFFGKEKTIFEVVTKEGSRMIRVTRGGQEALFDPIEATKVETAFAQAQAGKAWFEKLLASEKLPKKTPKAKPPQSDGYYLTSGFYEVSGNGISYGITIRSFSFSRSLQVESQYSIDPALSFSRGFSGGSWVDEVIQKVADALEAVESGKEYLFKSDIDDDGQKYTVVANLVTKEADVEFFPGDFFTDQTARKGHFGQVQLTAIRQLNEEAVARKKWFEENESLFFTRPSE